MFPPLGHPAAQEREKVGSKAAALSALSAAGFPVPAGFVVTEAALAALNARSPGAGVVGRLQDAAHAAGPGPYAVRSSAATEDLPGASFAGMYESYLKVAPADLAVAVQRCFDSANADRIRAYESVVRLEPGDGTPAGSGAAMAVLVQQMVDPVAAGVAFTANPLSGDRNETVISTVPGLAEGLVCGVETGEEWVTRSGRSRLTRGTGGCPFGGKRDGGGHHGRPCRPPFRLPQDIEWAVDHAGQVHILQARPMTALPDPVTWEPPGKGVASELPDGRMAPGSGHSALYGLVDSTD